MACSGTYNLTVRSYPDDNLRAVIDYLSAIDFAAKHADFLHRRQIGTGEWLVSDPIFQHLLVGKDRVLWCSGLRKAPQIVLIFHIYKEEELHTPQNMIGSLLKQIIQHTKELNEDTRKLYANGQQKGARPELNELTRIVIKQAQNFSDMFLDHAPAWSPSTRKATKYVSYTTQLRTTFSVSAWLCCECLPQIIAETCLTCLSFRPLSEKPCVDNDEIADRIHRYPFLRYSARYWGDHIRDGMTPGVKELALGFLSSSINVLSTHQVLWRDRSYLSIHPHRWGMALNQNRLHVVALFGIDILARDFLAAGDDVHAKAMGGVTSLHLTAASGHTQMVRMLLEKGVRIEDSTDDCHVALQLAASNGHDSVLRVLIDAGADCNVRRIWAHRISFLYLAHVTLLTLAQARLSP